MLAELLTLLDVGVPSLHESVPGEANESRGSE